ncbi:MAG: PrsW family glutamic-type intramembrane protease [Candidatus Paceibacterota bacterium]|jgi:RsiW-degrading membrane proteinase PrsW (M82 family)
MSSLNTIIFSLLGGILPAVLWLWFWLQEDRLHPEPKSRIIIVFLAGMASVFIVLPLERLFYTATLSSISILTIIVWAGIEEIFKYVTAYFTALKNKVTDEPIDAVIYMITVALGFSAFENTLFLFNVIDSGALSQGIITGNSRFLGATLLHVASSAAIGVMIGLAYFKKPMIKRLFLLVGIVLSIILHTIFNLLIIRLADNLFFVFAGVWVLIVVLIVLIEKIKKVNS